jgi:CO dehydrogenase/acetyl-CoA synthase alpha subunit
MTAVTQAIGDDLRTQRAKFHQLDKATGSSGKLSHARLLDVVARKSQRHATGNEVEVSSPNESP